MAALNRLSAKAVKSLSPGKYADGGGLWFQRRGDGGGQWFLRVTVHGRRREMGLGGVDDLTLSEVRDEAAKWRKLAKAGNDPIKVREKERRDAARNLHILSDVAEDAFESRKAELKEDGKAGRWFTPLALHVLPKLGKVPVAEIDQIDIRNTLSPIWHSKADTARKAINRLSIVMKHAAALGLDVDLQAVEKAKALLGKTRHQPQHIPALHWKDVPGFYSGLDDGSVTHLALRLLTLTGVRSKTLRHMRLDQIDNDVWTIPAEDMKGRKGATADFRVPLSEEALQVIEEAKQFERGGFLFPSTRRGVISDATMARLMERRGMDARPHGFRTSLRTWLADCTDASHEVAETMLAHSVGNKVERSYRRTDFLEQAAEFYWLGGLDMSAVLPGNWSKFMANIFEAVLMALSSRSTVRPKQIRSSEEQAMDSIARYLECEFVTVLRAFSKFDEDSQEYAKENGLKGSHLKAFEFESRMSDFRVNFGYRNPEVQKEQKRKTMVLKKAIEKHRRFMDEVKAYGRESWDKDFISCDQCSFDNILEQISVMQRELLTREKIREKSSARIKRGRIADGRPVFVAKRVADLFMFLERNMGTGSSQSNNHGPSGPFGRAVDFSLKQFGLNQNFRRPAQEAKKYAERKRAQNVNK